jgi:uncharacterized protein YjdB
MKALVATLLVMGAATSAGAVTLNPVADTDNQSDVAAGTNATLNISQYCTPLLKFDLSSVSGSVTAATLRVYFGGGLPATTITISTTSNDTWMEGGTKPTAGSAITTKTIGATGAGYIEFDLTAHTLSKMSGDKIVSVALSSTTSGWMGLNSRQASSNKPELVVTTSGGGGGGAVINSVRYYPRDSWASRMTGGQFQGSNDSSSWTTLATIGSQPSQGAWTSLGVSNSTNWRYVRYLGPANGYCNVAEVEFYSGATKLTGAGIGSAGSWNSGGNTFSHAIDGSTSTYYDALNATGDWVGLDLGSGGGSVLVSGIAVSPSSASISVGNTTPLTATVSPSNATNSSVSWTSSNTGIATVNSSGVVTGVAAGSAIVTAHSTDGSNVTSNNTSITVTAAGGGTTTLNPVADTDNQSDVAAGTNATLNISAYCTPFLKFDLSGISGLVAVSTLRVYYGGGLPATTITVSTTSNDTWVEGGTKPSSGSVITTKTIGATGSGYVDIDLTSHTQAKMSGDKIVSVALSDTGSGWMGLNSRQAASNKPQLVVTTGGGGGSVMVSSITLSPTSASVTAGSNTTIAATVLPSNATNPGLNWNSNNTGVATVNSSGVVHGVAAGSTTITAHSTDGSNVVSNGATVVVSGSGGGTVQRPSYNTGTGLFVVGNKLYDANGYEFVIRGVNKCHYDANSPGIPNSNANAIRWNIYLSQPASSNIALLQSTTINYHIVPIPAYWPAGSCPPESVLPGVVDLWVNQASTWLTIDDKMILNIANELGGGNSTAWRDAYITAIARLRAAGYRCPIMVDSGGCGQDKDDLVNYASAILNSDPQKNVIFSIHIYGNWTASGEQYKIDLNSGLDDLAATGLCIVVGEFGPGRNIGPSPTTMTPGQIITAADAHNFGWLAWAWDDPPTPSDENWFAMSWDGSYNTSSDLTLFGKDVVENSTYGLEAKAVKQTGF